MKGVKIMKNSWSKVIIIFLTLFILLPLIAMASTNSFKVGKVKAGFSSPIKSWVSVKWYSPLNNKVVTRRFLIVSGPFKLKVDYELKDSSRTVGYKLKAIQKLDIYNFSSWKWVIGGTGNSQQGPKNRWKKYTHRGSFDIYPLLGPSPSICSSFGRFRLRLEAYSTRGKHIKKDRIFYIAKRIPNNSPIPRNQQTAALRWAAMRLEKAATYKKLASVWRSFQDGSRSTFSNAMSEIIVMATGYLSDTNRIDFAKSSGLEILTGFADKLGETAGTLGEVINTSYMGYTMAKNSWSILKAAEGSLRSAISQTYLQQAAQAYDLDNSLEQLASACRDEAITFLKLVYDKGASNSEWDNKLHNEFNRLKGAALAVSSAKSAAQSKINSLQSQIGQFGGLGPLSGALGNPSQAMNKINKFLRFTEDLIKSDKNMFSKAYGWN